MQRHKNYHIYDLLNKNSPLFMGIINVTPDSFYDDSRKISESEILEQSKNYIKNGANIIDIGGESTRPQSQPVSKQKELERVIPVIEKIRSKFNIPISIDTYKSDVAEKAVEKGASIINDISAMTFDKRMVSVVSNNDVDIILMHIKGTPKNMQQNPTYANVVKEVGDFLLNQAKIAEKNKIDPKHIILDPGIGFGKLLEHNIALIKNFASYINNRYPVLIGHSRKSFIGRILNQDDPGERLFGNIGASLAAVLNKADILRVHDVKAVKEALSVFNSINNYYAAV